MECVSSNCLCGLAQAMPQNWKVVTYNIVVRRDKYGLENVLSKHSFEKQLCSAIAPIFCHGEGQTPCIEPAQRIPRALTFQHVVGTPLPPQPLRKQMSSSPQDIRQRPTALWGNLAQLLPGRLLKEVSDWRVVKTDEGPVDPGLFWGKPPT